MLELDTDFLRNVSSARGLTEADVEAIIQIAYLAGEIDFSDDEAEHGTLEGLATQLWELAGVAPRRIAPVSPLPVDDEGRRQKIAELSRGLSSTAARELAYALAYLLVASDLELGPVEDGFLLDLQAALEISDVRAAELAATSARQATPGLEDDETISRGLD